MNSSIPERTHWRIARKVSIERLEALSAVGIAHRNELDSILLKIRRDLEFGKSAAKTINKAVKILNDFFGRKEVRGAITEKAHRKTEFELCLPEQIEDWLCFCLIKGEINGRSGACAISELRPIRICQHALQRLMERIDSTDDAAVLDEIYACLKWAPVWNAAGVDSKAQCWPILSSNGFFVVMPNGDTSVSTLVTWMRRDGLSRKWGVVSDNLSRILAHHQELMVDEAFVKEFICSFPWMLREHIPSEDLMKAAWESRQFVLPQENDAERDIEGLMERQADSEDLRRVNIKREEKASVSYLPGLNYQESPPEFRIHSKHQGIVVQKRESGTLIISLKNSWYGKIPEVSNQRSDLLVPGSGNANVGDIIEVEVKKITFIEGEHAYAVSLDRVELTDATWALVEAQYPIGSKTTGRVFSQLSSDCAVQLPDGVRGLVSAEQVTWWLDLNSSYQVDVIGSNIDLVVSGYRPHKRNLIFETPGFKQFFMALAEKMPIGLEVAGTVVKKNAGYAVVKLEEGVSALLHRVNCWGKPFPDEGDRISAKIISVEIDNRRIILGQHAPEGITPTYYAIPTNDKTWEDFQRNYSVGQKVTVQVLASDEANFVVAMSDGNYGLLPFKEISWAMDKDHQRSAAKIGELFDAVIIDIKANKKRVIFSKKVLIPHPLNVAGTCPKLNEKLTGVVTNAVDYGYFVRLPFGLQGLLHKDGVPNSVKFDVGDNVHVYVVEAR